MLIYFLICWHIFSSIEWGKKILCQRVRYYVVLENDYVNLIIVIKTCQNMLLSTGLHYFACICVCVSFINIRIKCESLFQIQKDLYNNLACINYLTLQLHKVHYRRNQNIHRDREGEFCCCSRWRISRGKDRWYWQD